MATTGLFKVRGALAAALLLAVIVLMLAAASADAAFPGQDGKIAFSKDNSRQGTSGIFTVAPEGRLGEDRARVRLLAVVVGRRPEAGLRRVLGRERAGLHL